MVFDPAGLGKKLIKFLLGNRAHGSGLIEQKCS
jgi:hypothetical protein